MLAEAALAPLLSTSLEDSPCCPFDVSYIATWAPPTALFTPEPLPPLLNPILYLSLMA